MHPILLLGLVVGGIGTIAVLLHLLGLSKRKSFTGVQEIKSLWLGEFPDDPATEITLSHDHHAALIIAKSGRCGVVWPMGADATARYLEGAKLRQTKSGLKIHLPDFTAPHISLRLDPEEATLWAKTGDTPT